VRAVHVLADLIRGLRLSRDTSGALTQASDHHEGVLVCPSDEPQALALGSSGLVLPRKLDDVIKQVIAQAI
jgi:hypothetical protein